jgi:hypothetical protein
MHVVCAWEVTCDGPCGALTVSLLGSVSALRCVTHTSIASPLAFARNLRAGPMLAADPSGACDLSPSLELFPFL